LCDRDGTALTIVSAKIPPEHPGDKEEKEIFELAVRGT
jgi:hypothetical protein